MLAFSTVTALLFTFYPAARFAASAARDTYDSLESFATIIAIVQKHYVREVSTEDLIQGAIKGMVSSLDPHSAYLTPDLYKELQIDTRGEFGGLGIEITLRDEILTIITPIEDTPAFRAGVKPGDQIIKIDGEFSREMSLQEAVDHMRGKPGSKVTLSIHREGESGLRDIEITREIIHVKSVKRATVIEDHFAYLRLVQFQEGSASELVAAYRELVEDAPEPIRGVILDLRYNPGGLLTQAVQVSDMFLDAGLIVRTDGRMESQHHKFVAQSDDTLPMLPLVVLVNEGSASASEIVAGAIQDHGRGILVGVKTFGKGSVQTILPLGDDSALRLTTALYYTPSGRSINDKGIEPDVIEEYEPPVSEGGEEDGAEPEKPAPHDPVEFHYDKDNQIMRAIELLRGWQGDVSIVGGVAGFGLPASESMAAIESAAGASAR